MVTSAWIRADGEFSVKKCTIVDISRTGVQLEFDSPHMVLNEFSLLTARDAAQGCRCRVKWHRGTNIGAEFVED
jgi:hypothetical protein